MATLVLDLPASLEHQLRQAAAEAGQDTAEFARAALEEKLAAAAASDAPAAPRRPIWEIAAELAREIPPDVVARLPADGAEQLDHYVYGVPKRRP